MSVFVPVPYCLDDCGFVVEPEVRQVDIYFYNFLYVVLLELKNYLVFLNNFIFYMAISNIYSFHCNGEWNCFLNLSFIFSLLVHRNSENEYTTQSNLQFQCNPYQATSGIFHRARTNNFKICMEIQKNLE